jgi:hypothetical protein
MKDSCYVIDVGKKRYRYCKKSDVVKKINQLTKKSIDYKFWNFETRQLIQHSSNYVKKTKF